MMVKVSNCYRVAGYSFPEEGAYLQLAVKNMTITFRYAPFSGERVYLKLIFIYSFSKGCSYLHLSCSDIHVLYSSDN